MGAFFSELISMRQHLPTTKFGGMCIILPATLSWESFLSFFAFKAGMWGTQILALGGSPTVSDRFLGHLASHCRIWCNVLAPNISPLLPESECPGASAAHGQLRIRMAGLWYDTQHVEAMTVEECDFCSLTRYTGSLQTSRTSGRGSLAALQGRKLGRLHP